MYGVGGSVCHVSAGAQRGQKRALERLTEGKFAYQLPVLGSGRAASDFSHLSTCLATSPAPAPAPAPHLLGTLTKAKPGTLALTQQRISGLVSCYWRSKGIKKASNKRVLENQRAKKEEHAQVLV